VRFLVRTGLATGVIAGVLALVSVSWAEYLARSSCASVGGSAVPLRIAHDGESYTLIEELVPRYQLGERHSVFVEAPPTRVFESLKRAEGDEQPVVRLFDLLPVIAGKRDSSSLSEDGKPLYSMLRETSGLVVEKPNRELVTANIATADEHTPSTPKTVRGFVVYRLKHSEMKLPLSFRVEPEEGGSRLTTETRIMFADRGLCHDFGWYWGVIYPGSSLVRVELLKAAEHRSETALPPDDRTKYPDTASNGGVA
jgi:hypothetical protein